MIVNRRTYTLKIGRWNEAVALWKEMMEVSPPPHPWRMYAPILGHFDTLIIEFEYESVEECQRLMREALAKPGFAALVNKWWDTKLPSGTTEILGLIE